MDYETYNEGVITYDIQFRAFVPGADEVVQMIINIEAQNNFYPGYPIIMRGIYYCARMISSQYGTVFTNSHYEKIQKVYTIWICMNPPKERNNTITEYSFTEKNLFGSVTEQKGYYDLMNTIMICLGEQDEKVENDLLKLLEVLLSSERKASEKKEILVRDFDISMTEKIESEVVQMCNLSDGVEQKGIQKGIQQEKLKNAKSLLDILSNEEISSRLKLPIEEVQKLREGKTLF